MCRRSLLRLELLLVLAKKRGGVLGMPRQRVVPRRVVHHPAVAHRRAVPDVHLRLPVAVVHGGESDVHLLWQIASLHSKAVAPVDGEAAGGGGRGEWKGYGWADLKAERSATLQAEASHAVRRLRGSGQHPWGCGSPTIPCGALAVRMAPHIPVPTPSPLFV